MYQVVYKDGGKLKTYCKCNMDFLTAKRMLESWLSRYWDGVTNSGKIYPNGKGFYPFERAYIVKVK